MTFQGTHIKVSKADDHEHWASLRGNTIGSSEAAGCVPGGSPYTTPQSVYERKVTGEIIWPNNNMLAGTRLQPDVEDAAMDALLGYYDFVGRQDGSEELWCAPFRPRMTCTPDLLLRCGPPPPIHGRTSEATDVVVECKVTTSYKPRWEQKVIIDDNISTENTPPKDVLYQLQHQLAVLGSIYGNPGYDWDNPTLCGYVAVMPLGFVPWELVSAQKRIALFGPIPPSRTIIGELEQHTTAMLRCLDEKTRPALTEHYAEHNGQVGAPEKNADIGELLYVEAHYELAAQIKSLPALEEMIKPQTDKIKQIKDAAKNAIIDGGGAHLTDKDGEVLASYIPQQVLDWPKFSAACGVDEGADVHNTMLLHPEHIEANLTLTDRSRRLSIKRRKK